MATFKSSLRMFSPSRTLLTRQTASGRMPTTVLLAARTIATKYWATCAVFALVFTGAASSHVSRGAPSGAGLRCSDCSASLCTRPRRSIPSCSTRSWDRSWRCAVYSSQGSTSPTHKVRHRSPSINYKPLQTQCIFNQIKKFKCRFSADIIGSFFSFGSTFDAKIAWNSLKSINWLSIKIKTLDSIRHFYILFTIWMLRNKLVLIFC